MWPFSDNLMCLLTEYNTDFTEWLSKIIYKILEKVIDEQQIAIRSQVLRPGSLKLGKLFNWRISCTITESETLEKLTQIKYKLGVPNKVMAKPLFENSIFSYNRIQYWLYWIVGSQWHMKIGKFIDEHWMRKFQEKNSQDPANFSQDSWHYHKMWRFVEFCSDSSTNWELLTKWWQSFDWK